LHRGPSTDRSDRCVFVIAGVCVLSGRYSLGLRGAPPATRSLGRIRSRGLRTSPRRHCTRAGRTVTRGKRDAGADIDQRVFRRGGARASQRESDPPRAWLPPNATTTSPYLSVHFLLRLCSPQFASRLTLENRRSIPHTSHTPLTPPQSLNASRATMLGPRQRTWVREPAVALRPAGQGSTD
jgi:hypothetical protein